MIGFTTPMEELDEEEVLMGGERKCRSLLGREVMKAQRLSVALVATKKY